MSFLQFPFEMGHPRRLYDQHIAVPINAEDFLTRQVARDYNLPLLHFPFKHHDTVSTIKADKGKFQVNLDVHHFKPEEISVKTVDGFIVIEGRHEEKKDEHGWVSRQFARRYALPEKGDVEAVQSHLSSDGVLTITVPLERTQASNERVVPIIQTGPVKTQIKCTKAESADVKTVEEAPVENGE